MKSLRRLPMAAALLTLGAASANGAAAATVYGGNGHQYAFVAGDVNWNTALAQAAVAAPIAGFQAHLATIADAGEDAFVKSLAGGSQFVWTAGTDAAAEGVWTWAAGPQAGQVFYGPGALPGSYANWNPGEPNNLANEDHLQVNAFAGDWNDADPAFSVGGYVVEYSPLPAAAQFYAANGHYYQFVAENGSWDLALALAAAAAPMAGFAAHLVTITDAGEDAFVKSLIGSPQFVWAAGTDAAEEGVWRWAAGPEAGQVLYGPGAAPGAFTHWDPGEPNNLGGEDDLQIHAFGGNWNDADPRFGVSGYVVEYSRSAAVPEPASWALMIAGFGMAGGALRRRRALVA